MERAGNKKVYCFPNHAEFAIQPASRPNPKSMDFISREGGEIVDGVLFSRDSLEDGSVVYKRIILDDVIEYDADSLDWVKSLFNYKER